jgi:hypothetical protein
MVPRTTAHKRFQTAFLAGLNEAAQVS